MLRRLLAAATALLATAGMAAGETFSEDANWLVSMDRDSAHCIATQKTKASGGLMFSKTPEDLTFSVFDAKLTWLDSDRSYETAIIIDRGRWKGSMKAGNGNGTGSLAVGQLDDRFLKALERGSRLSIEVDGTRYGPYPLAGSRKAVANVEKCQVHAANGGSGPAETDPSKLEFLFPGEMAEWSLKENKGTTFTGHEAGEGVTVRLREIENKEGNVIAEVEVTKKGAGRTTFRVEGRHDTLGGIVGLARMDPVGKGLQLLFTSFWGGTHCCLVVNMVDLSGPSLPEAVKVGVYDTGSVTPEDIDGDGFQELPVPDERFRQFDGYAGTFPPEIIYAVSDARIVDVTRDPRFAHRHETLYRVQSEACGTVVKAAVGVCAGLAGTAANLGILPETLFNLDFETEPEEATGWGTYTLCEDEECANQKEFDQLFPALMYALKTWGYAPEQPDDAFVSAARKLAGRSFGDPDGNSEQSCSTGPVRFTEKNSVFGMPMFFAEGYEQSCSFTSGVAVGSAIAVRAACQGEGMPQTIGKRIYSLEGGKLHVADMEGFPTGPQTATAMTECPPATE